MPGNLIGRRTYSQAHLASDANSTINQNSGTKRPRNNDGSSDEEDEDDDAALFNNQEKPMEAAQTEVEEPVNTDHDLKTSDSILS